jgi:hypothetical protein
MSSGGEVTLIQNHWFGCTCFHFLVTFTLPSLSRGVLDAQAGTWAHVSIFTHWGQKSREKPSIDLGHHETSTPCRQVGDKKKLQGSVRILPRVSVRKKNVHMQRRLRVHVAQTVSPQHGPGTSVIISVF